MDSLQLITKVCKLYYKEGVSKIDIADKMRLSRFKVAKILEDAVNDGTVRIIIKDIPNSHIDLETELEKKYKLLQVVVADSGFDENEMKRNLGQAGAAYLEEIIKSGDVIGLAWGSTIHEMVESFTLSKPATDITIVQLTGGLHQVPRLYNPIDLTQRFASKFPDSKSYNLFAPAIVDTVEIRRIMMEESSILETINQFSNISIAIVGIGAMKPHPSTQLFKDGFIKEDEIAKGLLDDLAGDINSHFYDINGKPCPSSIDSRLIGITLEQLSKIRYVIALAGGKEKFQAIKAAITGRIVSILVTDKDTATALLGS